MTGRRALFSVSPFADLPRLARPLADAGWQIIATEEACHALRAADVAAVNVAEFNGVDEPYPFPPTLHPKMEQALTEDCSFRIDLVFDIPYPRSQGNDVGGRTLLALAAKGDRIPVLSIPDMEQVVTDLCSAEGLLFERRQELIAKVYACLAEHYLALATTGAQGAEGTERRHFGQIVTTTRVLSNGENPYQQPAFLTEAVTDDALALSRFEQLAGDAPCFTNLADLDAIVGTLCRLSAACRRRFGEVPALVVAAKHGNPCGVGASWESLAQAVDRALWGNPLAIWGGELVVNREIDHAVAQKLHKSSRRAEQLGSGYWMLDEVAAPAIDAQAVALLSKNKNRKLFAQPALRDAEMCRGWQWRSVRGGALLQPPPSYVLDLDSHRPRSEGLFGPLSWTGDIPGPERALDLIIAWAVAYSSSVGGNEVSLAKNGKLLGLGGGPSTVSAVEVAVDRAGANRHDLTDCAFAADAFFPFTDAPEILCDAGATFGVVPAGGKRHDEIAALFKSRHVSCGLIPEPYRGFCRH